jgi:hypothetical protein
MPKRIVGLFVLVVVLVTSGLLACVAPVATTPAPAATATPVATLGYPTDIPTATPTPVIAIPAGVTPIIIGPTIYAGGGNVTQALKAGDVVKLTVKALGGGVSLSAEISATRFAAMYARNIADNSTSSHLFQASVDGDYLIKMEGGNNPMTTGAITLTIEIYRK